MSEFIDGIAIQFYKGIGAETQYIAPFSRMNFFIGANNAGKSIILNFIADRLANEFSINQQRDLPAVDRFIGAKTGQHKSYLGKKSDSIERYLLSEAKVGTYHDFEQDIAEAISLFAKHGVVWRELDASEPKRLGTNDDAIREARSTTIAWHLLWAKLTGKSGGSLHAHWYPEVNSKIQSLVTKPNRTIHLIPAKRQLGGKGEQFDDLSGKGLIDHLAALQNPSFDRQEDRTRFERINSFLRDITGKSDALLEVPNERENLVVHMDGKSLPLEALGTGVHEVILIAAFCTIHDGSIMCIEEPEIHLHPLLQRKLVNYLMDQTSSQYFVATHSSTFIDTPNSSIFHVHNDGNQTFVKPVLTKNEQRTTLDDLGCQASDILQANCIIWVEGPSDRIYLKHWISAASPELVEDIHYSIMFYGGSLISHLSASDEALEQFIKLRDLNRHMAIVIDSDRSNENADIKPHATRLVDELSDGDGIAWITAGREVENYIDKTSLHTALKEIHPRLYEKPAKMGRYDNSFHFMRKNPEDESKHMIFKGADKVALANNICGLEADLEILDLKERVDELVDFIKGANNL